MGLFEYVAVLTSIIIGLGMAQLLQGLIRLIQHPEQAKPYWVHLLWVFYMFLLAVFWWWWEFNLNAIEEWTFGIYLFLIVYAVFVFLLCSILFPTNFSGYDGFKGYFFAKRAWFFGLFCFAELIGLGDSLIKGLDYFYSLGLRYFIATMLHVVFAAVAIFTQNEKFHGAIAVAAITYLVVSGFLDYETVGQNN